MPADFQETSRKNDMNNNRLTAALLLALACATSQAWSAPILGTELASFAVLGGEAVTNVGATTLAGRLGVSNNVSLSGITGFFGTLANEGPGFASGIKHQGDAYATLASTQLTNAMTSLGLMGPGAGLGVDMTGLTLTPGVYTVSAGVSNLTGMLTLDGGGNANAYWVFQMADTLITSSGSMIKVINTGADAGVFWNVGSSATLNTGSTFAGNILAGTSITMNNGVTLSCGRALAHSGAVTLIGDTINADACLDAIGGASQGLSGGLSVSANGAVATALPFVALVPGQVPVPVPEPGSLALYGIGLAGLLALRKKPLRAALS